LISDISSTKTQKAHYSFSLLYNRKCTYIHIQLIY